MSDTLVVTASRGLENRASVTQSVSVATAADIAALGSRRSRISCDSSPASTWKAPAAKAL